MPAGIPHRQRTRLASPGRARFEPRHTNLAAAGSRRPIPTCGSARAFLRRALEADPTTRVEHPVKHCESPRYATGFRRQARRPDSRRRSEAGAPSMLNSRRQYTPTRAGLLRSSMPADLSISATIRAMPVRFQQRIQQDAPTQELAAVCDLRAHVGHDLVCDHVPDRTRRARSRRGHALRAGRNGDPRPVRVATRDPAFPSGPARVVRVAGWLHVRRFVRLRLPRGATPGVRAGGSGLFGLSARGGPRGSRAIRRQPERRASSSAACSASPASR